MPHLVTTIATDLAPDASALSPSGQNLALATFSGKSRRVLRLHDLRDGSVCEAAIPGARSEGPRAVAFSADGGLVATGVKALVVLTVPTLERHVTLTGHKQPVNSVVFAPGQPRLVSGSGAFGGRPDNTVRLWDLGAAEPIWQVRMEAPVWKVACSEQVVASTSGEELTLLDATDGRRIAVHGVEDKLPHLVDFGPGGDRLVAVWAAEDGGAVEVRWYDPTGKEVSGAPIEVTRSTVQAFGRDGAAQESPACDLEPVMPVALDVGRPAAAHLLLSNEGGDEFLDRLDLSSGVARRLEGSGPGYGAATTAGGLTAFPDQEDAHVEVWDWA